MKIISGDCAYGIRFAKFAVMTAKSALMSFPVDGRLGVIPSGRELEAIKGAIVARNLILR
jgi:hypothetical protein